MIVIVNVSPEGAPSTGTNQYEVRINNKVICKFDHERCYAGLSKCLRDAADAVEAQNAEAMKTLFEIIDEGPDCLIRAGIL